MDGATASIHLDGKQVAQEACAFRPRDVFIGDSPEGNFIACSRNQDGFFTGRMDNNIYIQRPVGWSTNLHGSWNSRANACARDCTPRVSVA